MKTKTLLLALTSLLLLSAVACEKPATPNSNAPASPTAKPAAATGAVTKPTDPVELAIFNYIQDVRGLDVSKMKVSFKDQKVEGEKATCEVNYTIGEGGMPPMEYLYDLAKENGAWKVASSKPKGGQGHAAMPPAGGEMPAGHPGMGAGTGGDRPAGHPAMGTEGATMSGHGTTPAMPTGHPPVTTKPADGTPKGK